MEKMFNSILRTRRFVMLIFLSMNVFFLHSCELLDVKPDAPVNKNPITPSSLLGRINKKLGCIDLDSRTITISVWDNGTIDGDIVSVYVNGNRVINQVEMDGPRNPFSVDVTLENNGFNYILLYAHNEGSIPPNTASMSIDDGINKKTFVLSSDLRANGYLDLVVGGSKYSVSCN